MVSSSRTYGTVEDGPGTHSTNHSHNEDERTSLLSKPHARDTISRFRSHMTQNVSSKRGDLLLLLCYIITGLVDSSAVFIWGAFVSMQTGNSIYLGLGLADPTSSTRWIKSLISIASFCLGAAVFAWFHRFFGPKRRWVLFCSYLFQTSLIIIAAIVVMFDKTDKLGGNDVRWEVLFPLALVAFGSSGQAVSSRALEYNSLTSVVLTSIYCDLFSDPKLLSLSGNTTRNQRMAAPVALLLGAVGGGFWSRSEIGLAGALWTAAALKGIIVLVWLGWKEEGGADE